ncbi:MAG: helicase HerA-like domain-containing protein [Alphaproteobacteria bacterium]
MSEGTILLGAGDAPVSLDLRFANRHGLIAGATGTGKTVTLQVLVEGLSAAGVPVFLADVKGDLSGLAVPGNGSDKLRERAQRTGVANYEPQGTPVVFWDVFGAGGHPIRATISDLGPLLLAQLFELNDTQEGVLHAAFAYADDQGLLLLDLKDLRALLAHVADKRDALSATYGNIAPASVASVQRRLMVIEREGGAAFFGEPAVDIRDLLRCDDQGRGLVHLLVADRLIRTPRLYATLLLWLLAELFEDLPEVGDRDRPRFVLVFDEAHLLFDRAPRALVDRVEQVVRLIRSKGVGVYFVTQSPSDLPPDVLGQLGNRVQHALRAFTPQDQRAVRAAAETFRANPDFSTAAAITELAVGEALVSPLDARGMPGVVERAYIRPPASRIGPATPAECAAARQASPYAGIYDTPVDRESAYEILARRVAPPPKPDPAPKPAPQRGGSLGETFGTTLAKSVARGVGAQIGYAIVRGILGAILKGR